MRGGKKVNAEEEIRNRSDIVRIDRYIIVHTMILRCLLNKNVERKWSGGLLFWAELVEPHVHNVS